MNIPLSRRYSDASIISDTFPPYFGWNLQTGMEKIQPGQDRVYPYRVLGSGRRSGLEISLNTIEQNGTVRCPGTVEGYKVIMHSNIVLPHFASSVYRLDLQEEMVIAIKPIIMGTSNELRGYDPSKYELIIHNYNTQSLPI